MERPGDLFFIALKTFGDFVASISMFSVFRYRYVADNQPICFVPPAWQQPASFFVVGIAFPSKSVMPSSRFAKLQRWAFANGFHLRFSAAIYCWAVCSMDYELSLSTNYLTSGVGSLADQQLSPESFMAVSFVGSFLSKRIRCGFKRQWLVGLSKHIESSMAGE